MLKLNVSERIQFQYILPVQGNFKALELVDSITNKVQVSDKDLSGENEIDNEKEVEFNFSDEEIKFISESIDILDQHGKLNFQSLSLIRKIKGV